MAFLVNRFRLGEGFAWIARSRSRIIPILLKTLDEAKV
jgi:hypothetical protein